MVTKVCLLITDRFEPTADLLVAELRQRDVACLRWNLDQFPLASELTFSTSDSHFGVDISTEGRKVNLDDVCSIWYRGILPSGFPDDLDAGDRKFAETGARRCLDALVTVSNAMWINHPERNRLANSKPAQLYTARRVGLNIPPTMITNDADAARSFISSMESETVYKSLSQNLDIELGTAMFTGLLSQAKIANLELIQVTPGIFQQFLPKAYEVRTTIVGDQIFSAKIDSQAHTETKIDWRHLPFEVEEQPIDLPGDVETKIHAFMQAFGLVYGALDFIVTPDGQYVFLEINPAGQYMWVEARTGLKITSALVDALAAPCQL